MSSHGSQPLHWHFAYASLEDRNFQIHGQTLFFIVVVFSIVLLIAILILYAHWICSFRPLPASVASTLHHAPPPQPHGLDVATINSLPTMLHPILGRDKVGEAECCICLGVFQVGEEVKVLPQCDHCYHSECVDKWLRVEEEENEEVEEEAPKDEAEIQFGGYLPTLILGKPDLLIRDMEMRMSICDRISLYKT
ncbi:hypothetical protein RJ640_026348 [Escallonia rubra]|uniref:RING-type domain-containing protein n=1 Tax=Escallonia rubra TaxID=112253 RepID=A0AA88RHM4_9ASTE|nr:hypothetical protein RJ640_026348 [Escallonia rubra]